MAKRRMHTVRIENISRQMIPLQVRPPGGDFYLAEQQVRLRPGSSVVLPKDHLREDQIRNLRASRVLRVAHDSEERELESATHF